MGIVFSNTNALLTFLSQGDLSSILKSEKKIDPCKDGLAMVKKDDFHYFYEKNQNEADGKIFFSSEVLDYLKSRVQNDQISAFIQRAHRIVELSKKLPIRVPPDWSEYHSKDLITFFAAPRNLGNFRWIAQISVGGNDVCFWKITSNSETVDLDNFQPDIDQYIRAKSKMPEAAAEASKLFSDCEPDQEFVALTGTIDLNAATFGAVTGHKTYSKWQEDLNLQQRQFFEHNGDHSVKLRGPAGSGKTLALALKALKELNNSQKKDQSILFVTHSWAMAEQVDGILMSLNENGDTSKITVFPLLEIAKSILPQSQFFGSTVLGNDSYAGKIEQLRRISKILSNLKNSEWPLFALGCSEEFKNRVESVIESPKWNSLVWDLMHEFAAVLAAANILPGINAERKYLSIERLDWMMPLYTDGDRRFVLKVYAEYLKELRSEKVLTVDQVINDLLSYLETFAWNYRRETEGFDLIFIDEFHLFTEQERQVLNYLTKDPSAFPKLFMALDPRQSPYEVYVDFPIADVKSRQSGQAEKELGQINSIELTKVHRFSPQILKLVKFIQYSYPTLELGEDWLLDIGKWESSEPEATKPKYIHVNSLDEEINRTVQEAKNLFSKGGGRRLAIVMLDESNGDRFLESLEAAGLPVFFMRGRDDVDNMRYRRKSIILASAEYTAGLQFDDVIVTGLPDYATLTPIPVHQRRRILSLMYIAVSRATERVELIIRGLGDEYSSMLERAVQADILDAVN